jgi:SAM-dependent methyltransferase
MEPTEIDSARHRYDEAYYAAGTAARFPPLVEAVIRWFRLTRAARYAKKIRRPRMAAPNPRSGQCKQADPPFRILDIGCGRGWILGYLHRWGIPAMGTQLSHTAAAAANKAGVRVDLGDFRHMPLPGPFDLISLVHVFEHLDDLPAAIARLRELLRPGGLLVIEIPNAAGAGSRLAGPLWLGLDPDHHRHALRPAPLVAALKNAGFSLKHRDDISLEHGPFHLGQSVANLLGPSQANAFFDVLRGARRDLIALLAAGLQAPVLMAALLLYPLLAPLLQRWGLGDATTLWFRLNETRRSQGATE